MTENYIDSVVSLSDDMSVCRSFLLHQLYLLRNRLTVVRYLDLYEYILSVTVEV